MLDVQVAVSVDPGEFDVGRGSGIYVCIIVPLVEWRCPPERGVVLLFCICISGLHSGAFR